VIQSPTAATIALLVEFGDLFGVWTTRDIADRVICST
jgi:hypothetical protein